jgi:hypothetical protein
MDDWELWEAEMESHKWRDVAGKVLGAFRSLGEINYNYE